MKADSDAAAAGNAGSEQTRMLYLKSDNGLGFASSIIAFLCPVNCIVDSPPSNICIVMLCILYIFFLLFFFYFYFFLLCPFYDEMPSSPISAHPDSQRSSGRGIKYIFFK